jgi:hypothetical protein
MPPPAYSSETPGRWTLTSAVAAADPDARSERAPPRRLSMLTAIRRPLATSAGRGAGYSRAAQAGWRAEGRMWCKSSWGDTLAPETQLRSHIHGSGRGLRQRPCARFVPHESAGPAGGPGFTGWHYVRMLKHPVALQAS